MKKVNILICIILILYELQNLDECIAQLQELEEKIEKLSYLHEGVAGK